MTPRLWFVTFADTRFVRMRRRLHRQVARMGCFGDRAAVLSEADLDAAFRRRMAGKMVPGSVGYGCWCWKPQSVLQVLERMPEGDVLLYADAGCHLNPRGGVRLGEYAALAAETGIVAFQARSLDPRAADAPGGGGHFWTEEEWTKRAVLEHFGVLGDPRVTATGQLVANAMLFRKDAASTDFVRCWRDLFLERYDLCDTTVRPGLESPRFREPRYDQSIFSVLGKTRGVTRLSCGELFPIRWAMPADGEARHWPAHWWDLTDRPVLSKRDKGEAINLLPEWVRIIGRTVLGAVRR